MSSKVSFYSLTGYILALWIINTFTLFMHGDSYSWLWSYHSFILTTLAIFSFPLLKKIEANDNQIKWYQPIVILSCFVVFIFFTSQDYSFPNLWLDEYTQFLGSQGDPALAGASEQQPPNSYVLTKFLSFFFGVNKNTVRLTGLIPLSSALYFFLVFGSRVSSLIPFALLITCFFVVDPDIRYLSLEGRPVGLGVCSLATNILAITEFFKKPSKISLFYVLATSYIFLTSVGMQPVILLGYFSTLSLTFFLILKHKSLRDLSVAIFFSFFLFSPIQIDTLFKANDFKKLHSSFYERLNETISQLSLRKLLIYLFPEGSPLLWLCFFLISFIVAVYIIRRSKKKTPLLLVLLFTISFPIIFHLTYFSIINWSLNRWYYACYLVTVFVLSSAILANIRVKKLNWVITPLFAFILVLNADTHNYYALKLWGRPNWEGLYKKIKKEEPQRIYIQGFCNQYTWWCYNFFVGAEMWHKEKDETIRGMNGRYAEYKHLQDNGMIYDSQHLKERVHLSIVIIAEETLDGYQQILSLKDPPYRISSYENFIIIETLEPVFIHEETSKILSWLTLHLPKSTESFFPYSLLVWDYRNKGLFNDSEFWYQKLLNLPSFEKMAKKHPLGLELLKDLKDLKDSKSIL